MFATFPPWRNDLDIEVGNMSALCPPSMSAKHIPHWVTFHLCVNVLLQPEYLIGWAYLNLYLGKEGCFPDWLLYNGELRGQHKISRQDNTQRHAGPCCNYLGSAVGSMWGIKGRGQLKRKRCFSILNSKLATLTFWRGWRKCWRQNFQSWAQIKSRKSAPTWLSGNTNTFMQIYVLKDKT